MTLKNKILIVEDNKELMNQHLESINNLGYEIVCSKNFENLVSTLKNHEGEFFIALHDHVFANDFKNESLSLLMNSHIPTIVFSEVYDENIAEDTIANGALDYIINDEGIDYVYISQMIERAYKNQNVKAIVADGNESARQMQVRLLKKFNIESFHAKDFNEVHELLKNEESIGLVIVDQSLENEKGIDLIYKLRKIYSKDELAIIGVTEHGHSSRLSIKFLKKGANDFITKPFISEEFNLRVLQSLDNLEFIQQNKHSAMTDHLTSMYNKRAFESLGAQVISKAKNETVSLVCAMLDIDHFKGINDTYGHHVGDKVLVSVADAFRAHFRKDDLVARVGGEEFAVILSHVSKEKSLEIFEGFRERIEKLVIETDNEKIQISISIGLFVEKEYHLQILLQNADELLYSAKNNGRNQVKYN